MICVFPEYISKIDEYAEKELNISAKTLMGRAGDAVAQEALVMTEGEKSPRITVLCGGGNNGGDGYAAALTLKRNGALLTVIDVFSSGQRTYAGKYYLSEYENTEGVYKLSELSDGELFSIFSHSDLIIDAILGTGAKKDLSDTLCALADAVNASGARVLAVDVPLGVSALDGTLAKKYIKADKTLMLSYAKTGLYSYPAREACGELLCDGIGINGEKINAAFSLSHTVADDDAVREMLPERKKNSHKGSFGTLSMLCGSEKYRGAAILSAHAALHTGVGIARLVSDGCVCDSACPTLPEVIYSPTKEKDTPEEIIEKLGPATAVLVGCGCDTTEKLYTIVCNLLKADGCPVVLDADALNALSKYGVDILLASKRKVIITPHPAEMARLCRISTAEVSADRMNTAREFSRKYGVVTLLKGASTIITDGERVMINASGNSSLAKGGSGDTLAGAISSFLAQGVEPFCAAACGAYIHARAGEELSLEYSEFGVRPFDLAPAMAKIINELTNGKNDKINLDGGEYAFKNIQRRHIRH